MPSVDRFINGKIDRFTEMINILISNYHKHIEFKSLTHSGKLIYKLGYELTLLRSIQVSYKHFWGQGNLGFKLVNYHRSLW